VGEYNFDGMLLSRQQHGELIEKMESMPDWCVTYEDETHLIIQLIRRIAMIATHNDLQELIEFSIGNSVESAISSFPMFSPEQIRRLYDIRISQRLHRRNQGPPGDDEER